PDRVAPRVRDVDVARPVHRYSGWTVELCGAAALALRAPQGGDHPGRRDLADRVVAPVCHVDVARAVHRHPGRIVEPGGAAGAVGAAGLARCARQGSYYPG